MARVSAASHDERLLQTLQQLLNLPATDLHTALVQTSDLLAEAFHTEKVDIFLYDPAVSTLVAVGTSQTPLARLQRSLGLDRLPLANGGRMVEVFQTGKPYLTGHAEQDTGVLPGVREAMEVRSLMGVVMEVEGERRGVLSLASQQPDDYTEGDLAFLAAVVRWVGMVVYRAEVVEQLQREAVADTRRGVAEELVRVIAHDLQNHLTPLSARLQLIRSRAEREGRATDTHHAQESLRALQRLRTMIHDLLDDARLESGLFVLAREPVDLALLVRETVELLRIPDRDIQVESPVHCTVVMDEERMRQSLENLLANALKHTPPGTPIRLSLHSEERAQEEWVVVTVHDEGPGIEPTLLPHLFDRYGRGAASQGLGLGLYLAQQSVQAHGGTLTVTSPPGGGTTFHLAFPAVPPA